jgi:hypothetical protein
VHGLLSILLTWLQKRIEERERRRLDMDRYRNEVTERMEKGNKRPEKLVAVRTPSLPELNQRAQVLTYHRQIPCRDY